MHTARRTILFAVCSGAILLCAAGFLSMAQAQTQPASTLHVLQAPASPSASVIATPTPPVSPAGVPVPAATATTSSTSSARTIPSPLAAPTIPPPAVSPPPDMTDMPVVKLQSLDKISARTMTFEARVGSTVKFGTLYIKIQACRKSSPIDQPEAASFLQIWEVTPRDTAPHWVFSGWMFASSPGLSAMDHPVYDVWVLDCLEHKTGEAATVTTSIVPALPGIPTAAKAPTAAASAVKSAASPAPETKKPDSTAPAANPAPDNMPDTDSDDDDGDDDPATESDSTTSPDSAPAPAPAATVPAQTQPATPAPSASGNAKPAGDSPVNPSSIY